MCRYVQNKLIILLLFKNYQQIGDVFSKIYTCTAYACSYYTDLLKNLINNEGKNNVVIAM